MEGRRGRGRWEESRVVGRAQLKGSKDMRLAVEFSGFVVVRLEGTYSVASFCSPPLLTQRMLVLFPVLVWGVNKHLDNNFVQFGCRRPFQRAVPLGGQGRVTPCSDCSQAPLVSIFFLSSNYRLKILAKNYLCLSLEVKFYHIWRNVSFLIRV